jgi:U4/U6 small nuclear ribonucleoprotein PRP3
MASGNPKQNGDATTKRKRKRWGSAADQAPPDPAPPAPAVPEDPKAKALALQASVKARLAALKAKTGGAAAPTAASSSASLKRPPPTSDDNNNAASKPTKRAKHYELDMSVTAPTFKQPSQPAKKINPYLAHRESEATDDGDAAKNTDNSNGAAAKTKKEEIIEDTRLVRAAKPRRSHQPIKFVEPGTFVEIAERKRLKALNAEQSGFVSGRKTGEFVQKQTMAQIYGGTGLESEQDDLSHPSSLPPRAEANEKTTFPLVMEWWDVELCPSKLKKQVAATEGQVLSDQTKNQLTQLNSKSSILTEEMLNDKDVLQLSKTCYEQASLSYCKTAELIQHIVPIQPPHAKDDSKVEPTLYLTKKELKRQRKLRRQEKQRELQDMQAAGLIPPPEPRLTLQNFIRVLGDQAYLDPSQMEQKVQEQIQARQRAHLERNEAGKLTKEQRAAKKAEKLKEDTTGAVHVALFYVKDMSHPYHRTKVDLNAQQFNITGGVLECENPSLACVICEGGPKAIKKYTRLMTVRMKWQGPDGADAVDESDGEDNEDGPKQHKFNPENKCDLVWTGLATKRFFKGFVFQACETSEEARRILRSKGVGHYWDQILTHASGRGEKFQLKLAESSDEEGGDQNGDNDAMEEG